MGLILPAAIVDGYRVSFQKMKIIKKIDNLD